MRVFEEKGISTELKEEILIVLIFCADAKKRYDAFIEAGANPGEPGEAISYLV